MFPYFAQPTWQVGPIPLHAFGLTVAVAVWLGLAMAERRFAAAGLDLTHGRRLGTWVLVGGILGAHLFSVAAYFPDQLRSDPWVLLRLWEDISSLGGVLGGLAGASVYFAYRAQRVDRQTRIAYLDNIAFVFPFSLAIGRLGCALAHDHPGRVTAFPLAISLRSADAQVFLAGVYSAAGRILPSNAATLGFHDLGLYECLFLSILVIPLFLFWSRQPRRLGFYVVAFPVLYLPVRFAFDLLRVADARYFHLTPAQWVAALVLAGLPLVAFGHRRARFAVSGAVILATAWACWNGPR